MQLLLGKLHPYGQTTEFRKIIKLGPMYVISNVEPTIVFNNEGTFALFQGCNCYKDNNILTGQTAEFRKPIRLRPIPQTAMYLYSGKIYGK